MLARPLPTRKVDKLLVPIPDLQTAKQIIDLSLIIGLMKGQMIGPIVYKTDMDIHIYIYVYIYILSYDIIQYDV